MAQYINKDALVAEIEKLMCAANLEADIASAGECFDEKVADAKYQLCKHLFSFLDTLEVKEVDLDKEFNNFLDNVEGVPRMWHSDEQIEWAKDIARHFLELGIKAQKGGK